MAAIYECGRRTRAYHESFIPWLEQIAKWEDFTPRTDDLGLLRVGFWRDNFYYLWRWLGSNFSAEIRPDVTKFGQELYVIDADIWSVLATIVHGPAIRAVVTALLPQPIAEEIAEYIPR